MKLLAIDIGSAQIKAALFDSRFNRFEFQQHQIYPLDDFLSDFNPIYGGLTESQVKGLEQIYNLHSSKVDRIVTNIPNNLFTMRVLNFPFSDKKRINASARFQIEDEVPFDLEKCVIATQIFPGENKKSSALTAVAPISKLKSFLETLQNQAGIDADVITSPHSAFCAYFDRQEQVFGGKSTAIINLGHRKSSIVIFQDAIPVLNRTSMVGGYQITNAIAKSYNITLEEAEAAKRKSGFLAPPGVEQTEEQKIFSDLIAGVLEPVFHDFYQALMAHFSRNNTRVDQIFVSGGSSQMPGVCDYLAARWQIPVHPLNLTSSFEGNTHKLNSGEELVLAESLALGLSQVEGRSKQALNFRTGNLRSNKSMFDSFNLKNLGHPIRLAAIVYVVMIISLSIQSSILGPEVKRLEGLQVTQIKRTLPAAKRSDRIQYRKDTSKLYRDVNRIIKDLKAQIGASASKGEYSPLNLLRELSEAVPRTVVVEVRKLNLAAANLSLRLESPKETDLNAAIEAIKKVEWITEGKSTPVTRAQSAFTTTVNLTLSGVN